MGTNDIIKLAKKLRNYYQTNDPFKLCEFLNLEVREMNLNPKVYKAYTSNMFGEPVISINNKFTLKSQKILCSHELGHAILHSDSCCNEFEGNDQQKEYEANLFAVSLLFDDNQFDLPICKMSNYMLQEILNYNIQLK